MRLWAEGPDWLFVDQLSGDIVELPNTTRPAPQWLYSFKLSCFMSEVVRRSELNDSAWKWLLCAPPPADVSQNSLRTGFKRTSLLIGGFGHKKVSRNPTQTNSPPCYSSELTTMSHQSSSHLICNQLLNITGTQLLFMKTSQTLYVSLEAAAAVGLSSVENGSGPVPVSSAADDLDSAAKTPRN
ncbi:unnamed protein product [Pleuronectes platessa]|uniref:Uncharacterized protein n=1 Tax=Pleuronectes platessa TaxID=8262 RepID=A0A9N7YRI2_PLEPL|nr:unnamed protein product [Pleuronectes platessa]